MEKQFTITAPNGTEHLVKSADEAARFMHILSNGYMDNTVEALTEFLGREEDSTYEFGGWAVSGESLTPEQKVERAKVEFVLVKKDVTETVNCVEAIAHVCDCAINTVVKRLKDTPEGFTIKGWTVTRKVL